MKNFNKIKESSHFQYLDAYNLHGWAMVQTLPVNGFRWKENVSKFDEKFTKNYDQYSNKEYIPEVGVEYPKDLHNFHSDLPFSSERM